MYGGNTFCNKLSSIGGAGGYSSGILKLLKKTKVFISIGGTGQFITGSSSYDIELRPKGKNNHRVYVQCVNNDKGVLARKACSVACIGCGKCVKVCLFEAITLENNVAYIDPMKCKLCRKCEMECPQDAIVAVNFPPRKVKNEI